MNAPTDSQIEDCGVVGQELKSCYSDLRQRAAKVLRSRADVEDAAPETCERVLKACREHQIIGPARNFAFGVLRYVSLEIIRRHAREVSLSDEGGGGSESGGSESPPGSGPTGPSPIPTMSLLPSSATTPDEDDEDALGALLECLGEQPPSRRAFILRFSSAHGEGTAIARENGESPNAVTLRAYKIRVVLRKCINGKLGYGKGTLR